MIMVEVATLFLGWCNDQRRGRPGQHDDAGRGGVDRLVALINDMLEDKERGFKGLFAALTIGIFETDTGVLEVCSAGRNILHAWEADSRSVREYEIPTAPPAGTFSSVGVTARDLKIARFRLAPGDAVFLYTDGLDESKRFFRNYAGDIVPCREPPPKKGDRNPHFETHASGKTHEEFGKHRITKLLDAVLTGKTWELVRQHLPLGEDLVFDFTGCTGTTEEAVLALVAAERVFRTYRDPFTDAAFRIDVEPKIAGFLEHHFRQSADLFGHRKDGASPEDPVEFTHLKENPQYDDLALLVVRRPLREDGNR